MTRCNLAGCHFQGTPHREPFPCKQTTFMPSGPAIVQAAHSLSGSAASCVLFSNTSLNAPEASATASVTFCGSGTGSVNPLDGG
jgi:hypothetical protein